jgi:DNA replicative helicase MCM subunit Mcm2 (Cdc46/Mcm family)
MTYSTRIKYNLDVKLKSVPPTHEILTESIRDIST